MRVIEFLRTQNDCIGIEEWGFGNVLKPHDDPEGIVLPEGWRDAVILRDDIPRLTSIQWSAIQRLYVRMLKEDPRTKLVEKYGEEAKKKFTVDANNEVMVCFALKDDRSEWIVGVPRQVVGRASVQADYTRGVIDLISGKIYKVWPPAGYMAAGTSHSHNTMGAFFSSTDDRNELGQPGMHLVCGQYAHNPENQDDFDYRIASSVVLGQKRYQKVMFQNDADETEIRDLAYEDLVDVTYVAVEIHRNVMKKFVTVDYPDDWIKDFENRGIKVYSPYERAETRRVPALLRSEDDWLQEMYGGTWGTHRPPTPYEIALRKDEPETYRHNELDEATLPLWYHRERARLIAEHAWTKRARKHMNRELRKWREENAEKEKKDTRAVQIETVFGTTDHKYLDPARTDIDLMEQQRRAETQRRIQSEMWKDNIVHGELAGLRSNVRYLRALLGDGPANVEIAKSLAGLGLYVRGFGPPPGEEAPKSV